MQHQSQSRRLATGLFFIAPNVIGFLAFTLIPMVFSFFMAFTNWDLKRHNQYKGDSLRFEGIGNFARLLSEPEFFRYLGNTLFFMMGIPIAIAASLLAAVMLTRDLTGGSRRALAALLAGAVLVSSIVMIAMLGAGASALTILIGGLACATLIGGVAGGKTIYRTLFYLPSVTSGVAIFILWKRMYNSQTGPINSALRPALDLLAVIVNQSPAPVFPIIMWICFGLMVTMLALTLIRIRIMLRDGDLGRLSALMTVAVTMIPFLLASRWSFTSAYGFPLMVALLVVLVWQGIILLRQGIDFPSYSLNGLGNGLMLGGASAAILMALLGLAPVFSNLPSMTADGVLEPPSWLTDYHWAKPALMIMGLWAAIGSQTMLLYIAALGNVPAELYEAADIDGASGFQRFWHITWPQLAPTTFFIVVMSVIGGLQGGFESARTMTSGGPAGSTTTLAYFIYVEWFETGRLGYSSAVAWTLFAMIFVVTVFNTKVGSRYVND